VANYVLVESRSAWDSGDVPYFYRLAGDLAAAGNDVVLFLVQNGVLPARRGAQAGALAEVARTVKVLADDFSLRERAIPAGALLPGVRPAGIEVVVGLLAAGAKAVWH
jgi:hypothetical protein